MSETCACGHILDEHAGNGEWCTASDDFGNCPCIAFEEEETDDE